MEDKPEPDPEVKTCDDVDCGEHGYCVTHADVLECKCEAGYEADNSAQNCILKDPCGDGSKCKNGTCKVGENGNAFCECPDVFTANNNILSCISNETPDIDPKYMVDKDDNHMWDAYQMLVSDYGKACKHSEDCEDLCDSYLNNTCSRRCTSDEECISDDNMTYVCREDGRCAADTFVTIWKPFDTKTIDGTEMKNVVIFPAGYGTCNYTIEYSDGDKETVTECTPFSNAKQSTMGHVHSFKKLNDDGTVTIKVKGQINSWTCAYAKNWQPNEALPSGTSLAGTKCENLYAIDYFGPVKLGFAAFYQAGSLVRINDFDIPNLTSRKNMRYFFYENAKLAYANIGRWDTSNATNMANMFVDAALFNTPLHLWDTSNVTTISYMFLRASKFNQPIGNWDISKVTTLAGTFASSSYNYPLNDWDTSNVTSMFKTFDGTPFNQPIGKWNTSNVENMAGMFQTATSFNQYIGDWDTSKVTQMYLMFRWAKSFNQDISKWNTSKVTSMKSMFEKNPSFNQDISGWNTSNVTDMSNMFLGQAETHTIFNKDISKWNTAKVTTMDGMFKYDVKFNRDLSNWNVAKVKTAKEIFSNTAMSEENCKAMCSNENWKRLLGSTSPCKCTE